MATKWISPTWRMPDEQNQSKFENYSMSFDGSTEVIDLGNESTLEPTENITISCWVNITNGGNTNGYYVSKIHTTGISASYGINKKQPEFFVRTTGGSYVVSPQADSIVDAGWTHLVGTYDGSYARLYINGVQVETGTAGSGAIEYTTQKAYIGAFEFYENTTVLLPIQGNIDQVAIFDYALSQTQINYLYNSRTPQNPMAISGNAPIAYYPLGSGSTGDAAISSPSTLSVPNESVPSATVFNFPSGNYVNLGSPSSLQITGSLTLSSWVKYTSGSGGNKMIIAKADGAEESYFLSLFQNHMRFSIFTGDNPSFFEIFADQEPEFVQDTWYHIVGVFESGVELRAYINGIPVIDTDIPAATSRTTINVNNTNVTIGMFSNGSSYPFLGEISNSQIWNTALTNAEVATLYNYGSPLSGTQPQAANLKAWYPMDVDNATWNGNNWIIEDSSIPYNGTVNFKI